MYSLVIFDQYIGLDQEVPPQWARVDLGAMAIKGVLSIPPNSCINWASQSDHLVLCTGHWLGVRFYLSAEMQSVYATAPADWVTGHSLDESQTSAEMQSVYSELSLEESYTSAEIQSVYSTAVANYVMLV